MVTSVVGPAHGGGGSAGARPGVVDLERQLSPIRLRSKNNVANAGALEKIAHAKTGLPRTDDDDVFHVQTTAGSIQAKPTTHNKKNAKTHEGSRHQIEAWSKVTASKLDQPVDISGANPPKIGTEVL